MKNLVHWQRLVLGIASLVSVSFPPLAWAQYCPGGTTYFATVYYGCGTGSCWAATAFPGSTAGSTGDPNSYYACAASTPATGALENTLYTYDGNGNLTTLKDPLGRITTNTLDALNRLTQAVDPYNGASKPTLYGYDRNGVLAQVTDPRSLNTIYTVNGFGETTQLQSPDTGSTINSYELAGNLKTRTDARGVLATYTYDNINRVIQIVFTKSGSPTETHGFEYDGGTQGAPNAKGRLTKVTDPAAVTTWTYEPHGRVATRAQTIGSVTLTTSYSYNSAGQLQTMTTPSAQVIGFTYLNNQVRTVSVNGAALFSGASFDPFGPLAAWSWGNGQASTREHDLDGRLDGWQFGLGSALLRNDLTFYANNTINTINDPASAALKGTYQYDTLDRLAVSQKGNPVTSTQQFGYDPTGNRSSLTVDSTLTNYTYSTTSNQLQALTGGTTRSYVYDGAGNPTTISSQTYTYNLANRLVSMGSTATYKVNALGQRVQKVVGSTITNFAYDEQGHLLGEYDGNGALIQETVWLGDLPIAVLASNRGLPPPTNTALNVALPANGGVATASSTLNASYPASSTINGDRLGNDWGSGGGWADGTAGVFPDWLEVDFNGPKAVTEIDVFTAQDNLQHPSTPTLTTTFKKYGITNFTVQYWDGAAWQTVPGGAVTANNKVWRQFTFAVTTTSKIRVLVSAAADNTSRIVEVEAWGTTPVTLATYYVHADHLGSPRAISRPSDNTFEWRWDDVDPFGANAPNENPAGHGTFKYALRFPGQYYDAETRTHYNYFRDYDPTVGRYEQSDPIGLTGGVNTYSYVKGQPISAADPTGLIVQRCCRAARIAGGLFDHCWLRTDTVSAGMNDTPQCSQAGGDASGLPFTRVYVSDASCDSPDKPCQILQDVDEGCVNRELTIGRELGRFTPTNNCQSFVREVILRCSRNGPFGLPKGPIPPPLYTSVPR